MERGGEGCVVKCFFEQDFGKLKDLLEERGECDENLVETSSSVPNRFSLSPESGELTADDSKRG